jgi:hypothetical protein
MLAEIKKEIQLEIAHVLFIDVVGYSKLSINEQRGAVDELNQVVRVSRQFQEAEAGSRLIKIPTGDGMALVFYTSPEAPAQCAIEISRALKEHPRLQLRMGVHSGSVSGVIDVNGHANLAGAGLNIGQPVMGCGDAGSSGPGTFSAVAEESDTAQKCAGTSGNYYSPTRPLVRKCGSMIGCPSVSHAKTMPKSLSQNILTSPSRQYPPTRRSVRSTQTTSPLLTSDTGGTASSASPRSIASCAARKYSSKSTQSAVLACSVISHVEPSARFSCQQRQPGRSQALLDALLISACLTIQHSAPVGDSSDSPSN